MYNGTGRDLVVQYGQSCPWPLVMSELVTSLNKNVSEHDWIWTGDMERVRRKNDERTTSEVLPVSKRAYAFILLIVGAIKCEVPLMIA